MHFLCDVSFSWKWLFINHSPLRPTRNWTSAKISAQIITSLLLLLSSRVQILSDARRSPHIKHMFNVPPKNSISLQPFTLQVALRIALCNKRHQQSEIVSEKVSQNKSEEFSLKRQSKWNVCVMFLTSIEIFSTPKFMCRVTNRATKKTSIMLITSCLLLVHS